MTIKKKRTRAGRRLAALLGLLALPCACETTSDDVTVGGLGNGALPDHIAEPIDLGPEREDPSEPAYRSVLSRGGGFTVLWRPIPASIPINDHFELDVKLFRGDGTDERQDGSTLERTIEH